MIGFLFNTKITKMFVSTHLFIYYFVTFVQNLDSYSLFINGKKI